MSRKSSVTDKAVSVYSMSHSNYIWIGDCRLGRLGGFRYSERKDSSSNWLWINMQIQEYYIQFPLLSEGRGGPETFRRPGMPHGVFEKWIRRSRLLRLSSQLSAWWRDDLCKQRGDRQGKRERRALGMICETRGLTIWDLFLLNQRLGTLMQLLHSKTEQAWTQASFHSPPIVTVSKSVTFSIMSWNFWYGLGSNEQATLGHIVVFYLHLCFHLKNG